MELFDLIASVLGFLVVTGVLIVLLRRNKTATQERQAIETRLNKKIEDCKKEMIELMQQQFTPYLKMLDDENERLKAHKKNTS